MKMKEKQSFFENTNLQKKQLTTDYKLITI